MMKQLLLSLVAASAAFIAGCASEITADDDAAGLRPRVSDGAGARPSATQPARPPEIDSDQPVLVINGESLAWPDVIGALGEAAGGPVVEEFVLTSVLRREFLRRDWTLSGGDIDAEKALFTENLETMAGPAVQGSAVDTVRRARGLGPARFGALLERNAMLRRIVRDDVTVTAEDVEQALAVRYGAKVRVRLIVVGTEREASEIRGRLMEAKQAGADVGSRFAEEAVARSIDPSGPSGGLNEPISPADPSLPVALRRTIEQTAVGELSPVVAVDRTYALVLPEQRIEASTQDMETMRGAVEREVRLRKERLAMEEVARRMIDTASVTVFDPSLRYGWENQRRR